MTLEKWPKQMTYLFSNIYYWLFIQCSQLLQLLIVRLIAWPVQTPAAEPTGLGELF